MMRFSWKSWVLGLHTISVIPAPVSAVLNTIETSTQFTLSNDRLNVVFTKSNGQITALSLDEQDLLGPTSGNAGKGPYLDCSCTPSGFWTPGSTKATIELVKGTDSTGKKYAGVIMGDTFSSTNQSLYQYTFLREGETGLHMFSRLTYFNASKPLLRDLGELRTLFRPNTNLWTHLSSSSGNYARLPSKQALADQVVVQDATWYLGNTPSDGYVKDYSDYFTKYTFSESWRDHDVHGQFADGSTSADGSTFGAWLVHNTRETYYGGPLHSDLVVDGIVYNYLVSGHHGAPVPNITHGFDRTWGPQYYHFNKGPRGGSLESLRDDAATYADPEWDGEFYDSIAQYVPNYAPSSKRTTWKAKITLPKGAKRTLAVLSEDGQDFQLNVFRTESLQYWADVDLGSGEVEIPRVKAGTYRLTVYADGIFGWLIQDGVVVSVGDSRVRTYSWTEERAGKEIWRIGTPDKSAGEYRHGYAPDTSKPLGPEQYRIYWAKWDFPTDFPDGVNFHVGESKEATDWNYIHWSVFPGQGNSVRPGPPKYYTNNVSNWTVTFDLTEADLSSAETATLTVQLAGTKTANGNNKWAGQLPGEKYSNLPYTVAMNDGTGDSQQTWIIPYWRSGSCGVRSSVVCQNTEHKFVFDAKQTLVVGKNRLVLSLPFNATNVETATLPDALYVQYDALRFELA